MPATLLATARQRAAEVGLNLFGVVDVARFDSCQPKDLRIGTRWPRCGTAVLLGSGGRDFWQRFAANCAQAAHTRALPAPAQFASQCVRQIAAQFEAARLPLQVVDPQQRCPSFLRLAEAAGFGTVSPVSGLLLHPEFGPYVSLRAALLFEGRPFGAVADASITDRFQPCCSCRATRPAPVAPAPTSAAPCPQHPEPAQCGPACRCRASCPIGSEHRDGIGFEIRPCPGTSIVRWIGVRVMRFVRRRPMP